MGAGTTAADLPAPPEHCYVLTDGTDRVRLDRAPSGVYADTDSTFGPADFAPSTQTLTFRRGTGGNGERLLFVHLAPDKTVAEADFQDCVDTSSTQHLCWAMPPVPTPVTDCNGGAITGVDFAGCYQQVGGMLRVELNRSGSEHHALVSKSGGAASPWNATVAGSELTLSSDDVASPVKFSIGSTGRLWALAKVASDLVSFTSCAETGKP